MQLKYLFLPCTPSELEARLHALYSALQAALDADARGMLERNPRTGQAWSDPLAPSPNAFFLKSGVHRLVTDALCNHVGLLLRGTCGLSPAEETALRQLAERYKADCERDERETMMQRLPREAAANCCCGCGAPRPAPLRTAELRRARAAPQALQALRPLPRRSLSLRRTLCGGLEASQARGRLHCRLSTGRA
jgi:hypothetical protein